MLTIQANHIGDDPKLCHDFSPPNLTMVGKTLLDVAVDISINTVSLFVHLNDNRI